MKLKVAISGFGRIGRNFLRAWAEKSDTPLFMTLVEGNYTIIVASADGASQMELSADVRRQEVQTVRTEAGLMSAQDYFERSGW